MLRRKIWAVISSALMLTCAACTGSGSSDTAAVNDTRDAGELEVTFLDVGKADAIVLLSADSTVVIDCGEKGDGKEIVNFLKERERDKVDYLILSHYDKDHVGGAGKLIRSLDVVNVLAPDYDEQSEEMEKYRAAMTEKNITPQLVTEDMSFTLGGISYTVDAPALTFYGEDDDNDFSLVTKVVHGDNTLLFTGDAMEARLGEIMDIGKCTLLKVPYHGRKLDNSAEFLDAVKPECAVVCTSQEEFSGSVQKQLNKRGITYYSTCFNGTVTAVSDGRSIAVSCEKGV